MRPPAPTIDDDVAAKGRVEAGLEWMRGLGVSADGYVGEHDPVRAIRDLLATQECDEIIVSTLPHGLSSWLHQDLPHRAERVTGLPVTVVSAAHPAAP
jgi:GABA permease